MVPTPHEPMGAFFLASLLPFALISIPFAFGNYFLAKRIPGANKVLWVISTLIPLWNMIFLYYVMYKVLFVVLDALKAIGANVTPAGSASS